MESCFVFRDTWSVQNLPGISHHSRDSVISSDQSAWNYCTPIIPIPTLTFYIIVYSFKSSVISSSLKTEDHMMQQLNPILD
jgi:hypothetical protein